MFKLKYVSNIGVLCIYSDTNFTSVFLEATRLNIKFNKNNNAPFYVERSKETLYFNDYYSNAVYQEIVEVLSK